MARGSCPLLRVEIAVLVGRVLPRCRLSREEPGFSKCELQCVTTDEQFIEDHSAKRFAVTGIVDIDGFSNIKSGRSVAKVIKHAVPAPQVRHIIL